MTNNATVRYCGNQDISNQCIRLIVMDTVENNNARRNVIDICSLPKLLLVISIIDQIVMSKV